MRLKKNVGASLVAGHVVAETMLAALLALGLSYILRITEARVALGLIGGSFLLFTAYGLTVYAKNPFSQSYSSARSNPYSGSLPLLGFLTSFSNPYFTLWWASIGSLFIAESLALAGLLGVSVFLLSHWGSDFSWYILVSLLAYKGSLRFDVKAFKAVMYLCAGLLAALAVYYIAEASILLAQLLVG